MRHLVTGLLALCCATLYAADKASPPVLEPLMVPIPAGEFLMGSSETPAEQPIHKVKIKPFRLAQYPVTIKEFLQFTEATNYQATGKCLYKMEDGKLHELDAQSPAGVARIAGEYAPISCVSWTEVQDYISWLNQQTGKHYRLPSEAEWEYAARAGSNMRFHFGDDEKKLCDYGNGYDQTIYFAFSRDFHSREQPLACDDGETFANTIGLYKPNAYGLYDMQGNVRQWIADCYHPDYQKASATAKPRHSDSCQQFARGGSWMTNANYLRTAYRPLAKDVSGTKDTRFSDRGFRLALDEAGNHLAPTSEQQKDFLTGLTSAQKVAQERSSLMRKEHQNLLDAYKTLRTTPLVTPPMVTITGGDFLMGSEFADNEKPIHKVSVKSFRISKYEVTIKQFKQFAAATQYITGNTCWKFVNENGGRFNNGFEPAPGNWLTTDYAPSDFHPVMCVSWDDANAYLAWLSQQTGRKFRLPTEAEWEYAARAGTTTRYFFGEDDKKLCEYANTFDKSGMRAFARDKNYQQKEKTCDDYAEYTSIVGMYKPNSFGLYDVTGNVSEWVQDCDHNNYNGAPTDGSAWLADECNMRVRRGNTYGPHNESQVTMRGHGGQTNRSALGEGFRLVEEIDPALAVNETDDKNNPFEIELAKAQQAERAKRKTEK